MDASSHNLSATVSTRSCGEARQLMRQDVEGETVFYDKLDITCLWNGTYDKSPSVVSLFLRASVYSRTQKLQHDEHSGNI